VSAPIGPRHPSNAVPGGAAGERAPAPGQPAPQQLLQPPSGLHPIDSRPGDVLCERFPRGGVAHRDALVGKPPVCLEKHEARRKRRALVAVDERVVAAEVEEICSRNFDRVGDQRLAVEGGLRGCDRRLEQGRIAHARLAALRAQDLLVDRRDGDGRQVPETGLRQGA